MRVSSSSISVILVLFLFGIYINAEASTLSALTANLSLGSSGAQVTILQQLLNRDLDTRIASTGPGSPGNETGHFGLLTKAAVIRFQEKYASEVLTPAGLTQGNGYVGSYTRTTLNGLFASTPAPTSAIAAASAADYLVKDSEKIDLYAGDKMLANVQSRIYASINSAIIAAATSHSTATITPATITPSDVPSVVIKKLSSQSGLPGTRISVTGTGITGKSAIYFGSNYIIRTLDADLLGNLSFVVPPIPPARYDIAIVTNGAVSNTKMFVVTATQNLPVHLQEVSPAIVTYGGNLTITGSGFSARNNVVVTSYQKFIDVPSSDGKTLIIQPAPENLKGSAQIGDGTRKVPMSLYVVNDYGFSDSVKSFTMKL